MGLTATWAITTEPDRFAELVNGRVPPLLDWSITADAGPVRVPWSVVECRSAEFLASTDVAQTWAATDGSPLLLIGIVDSDGADLLAQSAAGRTRTIINLPGYAGSIFPGYAPFDDNGNMLEGAALEALERESAAEFDRVCATLQNQSAPPPAAAVALETWTRDAGLSSEPGTRIEEALRHEEELVEDAVRHLLTVLGLRQTQIVS